MAYDGHCLVLIKSLMANFRKISQYCGILQRVQHQREEDPLVGAAARGHSELVRPPDHRLPLLDLTALNLRKYFKGTKRQKSIAK